MRAWIVLLVVQGLLLLSVMGLWSPRVSGSADFESIAELVLAGLTLEFVGYLAVCLRFEFAGRADQEVRARGAKSQVMLLHCD